MNIYEFSELQLKLRRGQEVSSNCLFFFKKNPFDQWRPYFIDKEK